MKNDEKSQGSGGGARPGGKQGFKKKQNNKHKNVEPHTPGEFFKEVGFSIGPHGLEMYQMTMQKVGLYTSIQFKNGSEVTISYWKKS
jgi:hypothetical protein